MEFRVINKKIIIPDNIVKAYDKEICKLDNDKIRQILNNDLHLSNADLVTLKDYILTEILSMYLTMETITSVMKGSTARVNELMAENNDLKEKLQRTTEERDTLLAETPIQVEEHAGLDVVANIAYAIKFKAKEANILKWSNRYGFTVEQFERFIRHGVKGMSDEIKNNRKV